ncbi:LAFE_0H01772g1_1 [Lachancea fermentati]|uniref:LAFE_0H01772g1_1 n=1 Tax=Lachancea fermentati TaxID=4955 RepID=A0A1G4MJ65_LACFM|nr:LAFE_0H01772g1_1 [Lachancea fermentati]
MENSADSFEYILHLTKLLSTECRSTRQETDHIEQLLKRLAKLTQVSYEDLSREPSSEVREKYEKLNEKSEEEKLVDENLSLLYQIEHQECMNRRIWGMIDQIDDLLASIKKFVVEQKAHRSRNERQFIESIFGKRVANLEASIKDLSRNRETSFQKIELLIKELQYICSEIEWSKIPESKYGQELRQKLTSVENKYDIKLK